MGAKRIITGDAAGPRMADRRNQQKGAYELRRIERQRQTGHAGERMGDDDRLGDAEALSGAPKHVCLALGR